MECILVEASGDTTEQPFLPENNFQEGFLMAENVKVYTTPT